MKKVIVLLVFAGLLAAVGIGCDTEKPTTKASGSGSGSKAPEKKD